MRADCLKIVFVHREPSHPFNVIAHAGSQFEFLIHARCKLRSVLVLVEVWNQDYRSLGLANFSEDLITHRK